MTTLVMGEEKVTLQLSWLHQFQFAGFYVAKDRGYYQQAGLDVTIQDAQNKIDPLKSVLQGNAQYAVGHTSILIESMKGKPIILMAALYQNSPMMLLVREDSGIKHAKDLRGKRIMMTSDAASGAEIQGMLRGAGLGLNDYIRQNHSYNPASLEYNETDAMASYLSNEPFVLGNKGIKTRVIHPKDYGFDFYSDILFSSQNEYEQHPERMDAFYRASMKGWKWAFEHIEETAELIYRFYNPQHKSLESLIYEGKMLKKLAYTSNVPFGTIDPVRLEMMAQSYRLLGTVNEPYSAKPILYETATLHLNEAEKQWLLEHRVIRVGSDPSWPPIETAGNDKKHHGISGSYLKMLEKKLGIRFETDFSYRNKEEAYKALRERKLDMLSSVDVSKNEDGSLVFSEPYMQQSMVIVAKSNVAYVNDLNDLKGKKIAVVRSHATENILRKYYPDIIPIIVETSLEALQKVSDGEAYGALEALNVASYLIEKHNLDDLRVVGESSYRYSIGFGFRNDYLILANIINKALKSLSQEEYNTIHGQWMVMEPNRKINYDYVWMGAGLIVFVLLLAGYKNRQLDTLVKQRTKELQNLNRLLEEKIETAVEKNRAQEKILMQQAKMAEIGSMLESIAHQWRQPLNILGLTMTRLNMNCTMGIGGDPAKFLEIAETQIQYMSQTIDDFRNFFKQDKERVKADIATIVDDVEMLLGPLLTHKKITMKKNVSNNIELFIYPNELKQVLINIVNNAREALEQNKSDIRLITIGCTMDEKTCTITIDDSGGGIPEKIMNKIFDPYFTTKFESQGTGIGLYMAKMIVEKHFLGELSTRNSENGARFEIKLPRLNEEGIKAREDAENV